jgi:mono/diheme cytochrome c family protein
VVTISSTGQEQMRKISTGLLCSLWLAQLSYAGDTSASPLEDQTGASLYTQLCVSCHGPAGRGDGPAAPALKVAPPDLTAISHRNGGTFPTGRIREIVDGRAVLPAHGTRDMPVWGYELEARSASGAARATAQAMTDRLVAYLQSIQLQD